MKNSIYYGYLLLLCCFMDSNASQKFIRLREAHIKEEQEYNNNIRKNHDLTPFLGKYKDGTPECPFAFSYSEDKKSIILVKLKFNSVVGKK
jgi:hypothetical protein